MLLKGMKENEESNSPTVPLKNNSSLVDPAKHLMSHKKEILFHTLHSLEFNGDILERSSYSSKQKFSFCTTLSPLLWFTSCERIVYFFHANGSIAYRLIPIP